VTEISLSGQRTGASGDEPGYLASTRAGYDAAAEDLTELWRDALAGRPMERAMLGAFAEIVQTSDLGPVADAGAGAGRVTGYLHSLGVPICGIDLSPAMLAIARREHPDVRFSEGSMTALDLPDGSQGGVLAWYSVIHIPPPDLPRVFAEFGRVLAPGGHVLLAFQVGDEPLHLSEALGHEVSESASRGRAARLTRAVLLLRRRTGGVA
jgi:SAM-dependent methyltransferase